MNSKPIILTAFAIWCFICGRWYVCGIKEACITRVPAADVIETPPIETPETDTIIQTDSNIAAAKESSESKLPPDKKAAVSPDKMDNVQMEQLEDRMLIYFPYKSSRKEDNAAIDAYLSELAQFLIQSGNTIRITGHTDFVGEPKENYQFGLRRAYSIRDILIKKGVPSKQIICKSYGDTKPVATNDTPYGRYLNRRAEIRIAK